MIKDLRTSIEKNLNQLKEAWANLTKQQKITLGVLTFVVIVLPLSLLVLKTQTNLFPKATYPTTPPVSPTPTSTPITSPVSPTPWPSSTPTPTYIPSPTASPYPSWTPTPSPSATTSSDLDDAVIFLSNEDQFVTTENYTFFDLRLNTLGNEVKQIDVQLLVRGPFDRDSLTISYPPPNTQFGNNSSMRTISSASYYEYDDGVRVHIKMESDGPEPFNEGSGAIPMFGINLRTQGTGVVRAYIDGDRSSVVYYNTSKNSYDNYTPESNAALVTVMPNPPADCYYLLKAQCFQAPCEPQLICEAAIFADLNKDNRVDISDYSILVSQFMQTGIDIPADLNGDGIVDISDYSLLIQNISL